MAATYPVYRDHKGVFPLSELAQKCAEWYGKNVALRAPVGTEHTEITYIQLWRRVQRVARWLIEHGIVKGDKVAVVGDNSPEWAIAYLAIQASGAIAVPVDKLLPISGVRHILTDSKTKLLFAHARFLEQLAESETCPTLESCVSFNEPIYMDAIPWSRVLDEGDGLDHPLPKRELDEIAALLYTSGTTGHAKGVILTQRNLGTNLADSYRALPLGPGDNFLSVLPVHHSFEGTAGFLFPLYAGAAITYARSLKSNELLEDIKKTNVTIMLGVPLLYEKMHAGILRKIKKAGKVTRFLFSLLYAMAAKGETSEKKLGRKLFRSMRDKAGLGSVVYFVSGGGPLDPATSRFFNRLGIHLLQGFGLTETSPITHLTPPKNIRHECVGLPFPTIQAKIDKPDENGIGELVVKGPSVFTGYYENKEATEEVLDKEGWFHTGDLGIIFDDGYLQITGRKKNLLVTGGGKNVFPEEIEYLVNRSDFIAESLVLGIPRSSGYGDEVGALIFPDYEQVDLHFEKEGKKATAEDVSDLIKNAIKEAQNELSDYKHIRHFRIVEEEFQKTSTRKIKRYLYNGEMVKMNGSKV